METTAPATPVTNAALYKALKAANWYSYRPGEEPANALAMKAEIQTYRTHFAQAGIYMGQLDGKWRPVISEPEKFEKFRANMREWYA